MDPQQQTCKVCHRPDKFDFHVPDEIWEAIVPPPYTNRIVCLYCFDDFASLRGVVYAEYVRTLYFAGEQSTFEFTATSAIDKAEYRD